MAKLCPQCEKENPNAANVCMFCGTILSEENLDETARLQMELNEANKTIALLKKSLAEAHEKIDNNTSTEEIELLKKQLITTEDKQKKNQNQISDKNKEIEQLKIIAKKKKSNSARVFFLLLSIALGITVVYFFDESNSWKNRYYSESSSNQSEAYSLKNEIDNLKNENTNLQSIKEYLQSEISNLKAQVPKTYKTTSRTYLYKIPQGETTGSYYDSDATITIYTTDNGYGLTYHGWVLMYYLKEAE